MEKPTHVPLNRERVLQAAVDVADRDGLGALTMRRLGAELSVEAMSLYKHVANKDDILDGIVDVVIGQIEIPEPGDDWRGSMRRRALSAREVLGRHSWAVGLLEARAVRGPVILRYADAILGILRSAGFSIESAGYAFWALDSYVYGHVIQEAGAPDVAGDELPDSADKAAEAMAAAFPHLAEVQEHSSRFSYDDAFDFGLDLLLDSLERTRSSEVE